MRDTYQTETTWFNAQRAYPPRGCVVQAMFEDEWIPKAKYDDRKGVPTWYVYGAGLPTPWQVCEEPLYWAYCPTLPNGC